VYDTTKLRSIDRLLTLAADQATRLRFDDKMHDELKERIGSLIEITNPIELCDGICNLMDVLHENETKVVKTESTPIVSNT
jgi:hypothetical protein